MNHGQKSQLNEGHVLHDILAQLESIQNQVRHLLPERITSKEDYLIQSKEDDLGTLAELEISRRNLRLRLFPDDLFGEAGWNILLDLFAHELKGRKVSITSACLASQAPETTGLRYVNLLVKLGLVTRENDPVDLRKSYLRLTPDSREKLSYFLSKAYELRSPNVL